MLTISFCSFAGSDCKKNILNPDPYLPHDFSNLVVQTGYDLIRSTDLDLTTLELEKYKITVGSRKKSYFF